MSKIRILSILMSILIFFLAGCSENGILKLPNSGNTDNEGLKTSTEISIPIEKFRSLNPILLKDEDVYFMEKLIYDGLIDLDQTLAPIPKIAETWAYSDQGKVLTFNIRNDIKWHDGKPLTANDVKFTIDALIKTQFTRPSVYTANILNIKSVAANGNQQVIIKFKTQTNNNVENFTFPIIPSHQFDNFNDAFKQETGFIPIGTGPYKVVFSDEVQKVVLKPNDLYYGDKKAKNTLIFKIIPNKAEAVNLFEIGDLMLSFSQETDREKIFGDKDVNIYPYVSNQIEVLGFNTTKGPFKDKRVRAAIASAIDTAKIIEEAYYTNGVRNDNLYFPNYLGINSSESLIVQNFDKSKKLLTEAGFINRDTDPFVEDSNDQEITISILVNNNDASRLAAAEIIKNSLDKLPIHTYIMLKDWSGYSAALSAGDFDAYLGGWKVNENYDLRFALHSLYNNTARYADPILDSYLDLMQTGLSKDQKLETFKKIKTIINEELPYYCLTYKTYSVVTSKSLQGVVNPYFFNRFHECEDWSYIN